MASVFADRVVGGAKTRWSRDAGEDLRHPSARDLQGIGGSRGLPIVGAMPLILSDPAGFFARLQRRHGPLYRFHALGQWHVHAVGPEAHERILFDQEGCFSAKLGWGPLVEPLLPGAVLIQDGAEHRRRRRVLGEAFKAAELQGYQTIFDQDVRRHLDCWDGPTDIFREAKRLSFDIAASTFMGLPLGTDSQRALKWFGQVAGGLLATSYNPWLSVARLRGLAAKAHLEKMLGKLVRDRRRAPGTDFLSRLSAQLDEDGDALPEQEVLDALIFLLIAAHDTMSSALTSCLWFLASQPEWASRLRDELRHTGIDSGAEAGLARLPLMTMFFKEAVRLNPPAPVVWRRTLREVSLYGRRIPAGTMVGANLSISHRLPDVWPDPTRFDPSRFTPDAEAGRDRFAYAPFGAGIHKCLGMHFAQQHAKTVMAHALLNLGFERPLREARWYGWPSCRPSGRLVLQVARRPRGS